MNIFIDRNGEQFGPYSVDECLSFLSEERLSDTDLAWREGMTEWQPLHQVLRVALEESPDSSEGSAASVGEAPASQSSLKKTMRVTLPDEWKPIDAELPPGWDPKERKTPPVTPG
jgi:hypothetical protein